MSTPRFKVQRLRKFSEIARVLPRTRKGKTVAVSTLHRWRSAGCRGIFLEATRTPAGWCTTLAAVNRFFAAITKAEKSPQSHSATPERDEKHQARLERELEAFGL